MNYDYSTGALSAFQQNKDKYGLDYSLIDNPGLSEWGGAQVPIYDGQVFTLMYGGKPVYQGVGAEGLQEATRQSASLGGGWQINGSQPEQAMDWNEEWFRAHPESSKASLAQTNGITYASKSKSDFDPKFLLGALPFAAAVAAPALGGLLAGGGGGAAGAGAAGAAGAAGSAGAGVASATGIGSAIGSAAGLASGLAPITVIGGAGAGIGATAAGIGAGVAGAGAALGGSGGGALPGDIVVNAAPAAPPVDLSSFGIDFGGLSAAEALGAGQGAAPPEASAPPENMDPNDIVVSHGLPTQIPAYAVPVAAAGAGAEAPPAEATDEIVVSHPKPPALDLADIAIPGITAAELAAIAEGTAQTPPAKSTLDKIVDYLKYGGIGVGVLGNLLGGSNKDSDSPGTIPAGLNNPLNPIFNSPLPSPAGPAANLGVRGMPAQDWNRYGMRPEQSFFANVPQGYVPPAPGVRDPQWDKEQGFAVGGKVRGAGSGRDDSIAARLSDGEYVVDAETVALLGDGSSKAGADRLDDFRVALRKDKGRDLAKGRFSVKAKSPERYMAGGK